MSETLAQTLSSNVKRNRLLAALAAVAGVLLFKIFVSILLEYRWYFPPDFDRSSFLSGRRFTFVGEYRIAFYFHIVSGPIAIVMGTILFVTGTMAKWLRWHSLVGRLQMVVVLAIVVPSGWFMAQSAYAGPIAGWGFKGLSIATAVCVAMAWRRALQRRFADHRYWATHFYLVLISPLLLRLVAGMAIVLQSDSDVFYQANAWLSWLIPAGVFEAWSRFKPKTRSLS